MQSAVDAEANANEKQATEARSERTTGLPVRTSIRAGGWMEALKSMADSKSETQKELARFG